jgi:hypothetical protein
MKNRTKIYSMMIWVAWIIAAPHALAAEPKQPEAPSKGAVEKAPTYQRVGGLYRVESIQKQKDNSFQVVFESVQKTKKHNKLVLATDHVHLDLEQGYELRLSAEILSEKADVSEVSQVLLFLPKKDLGSHIPVWLLSNRVPQNELRGARYLEMHSPASDYTVF